MINPRTVTRAMILGRTETGCPQLSVKILLIAGAFVPLVVVTNQQRDSLRLFYGNALPAASQ